MLFRLTEREGEGEMDGGWMVVAPGGHWTAAAEDIKLWEILNGWNPQILVSSEEGEMKESGSAESK